MPFLTLEIRLSLPKLLFVIVGLVMGGIFLGGAFAGELENGYLYAALVLLSSGIIILKSRHKKQNLYREQ